MNKESIVEKFEKDSYLLNLEKLIESVSIRMNEIKIIKDDKKMLDKKLLYYQDLYLHKIKQKKLLEDIYTESGKRYICNSIVHKKINIDELYIKEIDYIEQVDALLYKTEGLESNRTIQKVFYDQQIFILKVLYLLKS